MRNVDKRSPIKQKLFPENPRDFPGRRMLRSILRTVHILGGGVLIGAYLFEQTPDVIKTWFMIATWSGFLLFMTDLHASLAIFFEWRGASIIAKIGLLVLLPIFPGFEIAILIAILTIGSLSSHLSRNFRHRLWWAVPGIKADERHG